MPAAPMPVAPAVAAAAPPEPPRLAPAAAAKPPEPPKPAPPPEPPKPAAAAVVVERPAPTTPTPAAPPARPAPAGPTRVTFEANSPALSTEARAALDKLAAELVANPGQRTILKIYAANSGPESRRLLLARGLAVRAYLIDKGVAKDSLNLQPLGTSADGGPADRVDAVSGTGT
jgi:outer membrane protein OmpA-like peptidoglycan-associated protein